MRGIVTAAAGPGTLVDVRHQFASRPSGTRSVPPVRDQAAALTAAVDGRPICR
jgi:hypothetical protein